MSSAITNHLEVSSKATLCPIVLACDDSYGMPLATALRSMVEANRHAWPIQCYVLSDGVGEKTKRKVLASLPPDSVVIHWMPVELSAFAQFSTISHISKITYARFVITQIIPSHVSRALYLDSDLLVLDDLGPLCQTDLGDGVFGAVVDSFMDQATKQNRPGYERVPRVQNYFNAGVLLIDLKRWRERGIPEKATEYMKEHPDSPYSDQDALNVVCDGRWKPLDSRWNFQNHEQIRLAESGGNRPAIVHFVTDRKPWVAEHRNINADFYDCFRNRTCYARTAWERLLDCGICFGVSFKGLLGKWTPLRLTWRFAKRAAVTFTAADGKAGRDRQRSHSFDCLK